MAAFAAAERQPVGFPGLQNEALAPELFVQLQPGIAGKLVPSCVQAHGELDAVVGVPGSEDDYLAGAGWFVVVLLEEYGALYKRVFNLYQY